MIVSTSRLNLRGLCACAALMAAFVAGCAAPVMPTYLSGSRRQDAQQAAVTPATAVDPAIAANDPKAVALRKALGQEPATSEDALNGVLKDLQEIGDIDRAAQQKLLVELRSAKPEQYRLIVTQFRSELDYRRQLAERELREQDAETQLATDGADSHEAPSPVVVTARDRAEPRSQVSTLKQPAPTVQVIELAPPPADEAVVANAISTPTPDDAGVQQASASNDLPRPRDWRGELETAIDDLETFVEPQPTNVAELQDHLRLRALQLVAGREEEAYKPIPGASPGQQDYWSKQLFAMGAYLSTTATLDDKQRAATALVHLDDARAALAQLATLQIKNLSFVKRVDGYGAYEPLELGAFEPGTPVTLYAEVENFASASTAAGFETLLATSYQVLDHAGQRIDGAQFPDVSDVCRGRRRDFHLQYGVTLPTRISPGKYQMELTITDQRSGKIGRATLPFEINPQPVR